MRASRIRFLVAVAATLGISGCVTLEANKSTGGSSGGSYQFNAPGAPSVRASLSAAAAAAASSGSSSDWEYGVGVHAAPAFNTSQPGVTVHPMASYTYFHFSGGHDDRFEFGGQVRKTMGAAKSNSFWLGAEAAYALFRTHIDNVDNTQDTNGWSITGLAGVPVGDASMQNMSVFGGVGFSHYGGNGINLRIGLDMQPSFMKR